ncbi:MAG: glycine zipper 2TM domain-containing protein [Alphaproteobacteria bacterium]|nr:MAG: glycine zipper 2TM domain-containing protein [Alphaproteobacteria bacterium]
MTNPLKQKILALSLAAPLTLTACQGMTNEQIGTFVGALGGAYLGSEVGDGKTGAIILGGFLGAFIGGKVGAHLDARDKQMMYATTQQAMESSPNGATQSWSNPQSGASGSITPTSSYQNTAGNECRTFSQNVAADGQTYAGTGTACKQPDGSWQVVS